MDKVESSPAVDIERFNEMERKRYQRVRGCYDRANNADEKDTATRACAAVEWCEHIISERYSLHILTEYADGMLSMPSIIRKLVGRVEPSKPNHKTSLAKRNAKLLE